METIDQSIPVMRAIAIDDEPIALEIVQAHAARVPFVQLLAVFTDAFQAMSYLQQETVDLIFLDIKMPDISGLEFYQSLRKKPLLIFTTAYTEHAVTSFEMDAVDYLLKPFSLTRFLKGCNKAYELFLSRNMLEPADHLYVKTGYDQVRVAFSDILYLEAAGNYMTFVLKDRKIISRLTVTEAMQQLPPNKFVRVHRSFIVALHNIEKLERHQVTVNKVSIPIGDAYSQNLASLFKK